MMKTRALIFSTVVAAAMTATSGTAVAASDGENLFNKKCGTCHSFEPHMHKVGPSLAGIFGRQAGASDYPKYKALKDADWIWDEASIDDWIADPKGFSGKPTPMTVKIKNQDDRTAIIEYLKSKMD